MAYIVVVYAPFIVFLTLLKEAPTIVLARKSFFLSVVFVSLRDTTGWLVNLFTFFWYVQMNLIARLRGEGDFETAGQVVHYGTVATFIGGIVVAAIFAGVARQLLSVISFSYAEPVLDLGLSALYAWAAGLPAVVLQAPVTGALLGMHQFVRLALLATLWSIVVAVLSLVMVTVQVPCDDKPAIVPETYLCPGSKRFLLDVSIVAAVIVWLTAAHLVAMQYKLAARQGMFPNGMPRLACVNASGTAASTWAALRSTWSRDTAGVAVRSVLNNTREFITLVVALRIGLVAAALYALFASVSAFSYSVPNMLSTSAMTEGSKQLGRGDVRTVVWCLKFFHAFGALCGVAFAGIIFFQREAVLRAYSGESVYAGFGELAAETWPLFVAFQPINALVGVFGPLLMTTQNYTHWGGAVSVCFFAVFLPVTISAAYARSTYRLLLAEVLYSAAHLLLLIHKVSWVELRRLIRVADEPRADAAAPAALGAVCEPHAMSA
ncbi:hypothetical protein KFE25_004409 [Diacronema lutheri]|uniref:Uncharacterized protein n=1 Tax=Diacronema lutheri TaxID=2081491 RepID=A0A8J6C448_DIALT|nr:hypothetical protein KFE25_004409 [Diacronema lutheri]